MLTGQLHKTVRILVPLEWTSDEKGAFLEGVAGKLLQRQRYSIIKRVRFTGMEIDLIADHIDTRERAFVECKFVADPFPAGVISSLVGKAVIRQAATAYLFSTAPPGKEARGVIDELQRNPPPNSPKLAYVGPDDVADMFVDIYDAQPLLPKRRMQRSIASATLVVTPELGPFWVLEEHRDGIPERAHLQPVGHGPVPSAEAMAEVLRLHGICEGLEMVPWRVSEDAPRISRAVRAEEEVITPIAVADSLDDYRPCRPEDFVGRHDAQKQVWDFLARVREDVTATRVLALSGPSGYGKSSVILKLADRFRNQKWANKFYLFPVDVRSARGPLFVAKAVKTAMERAIQDGFVGPVQGGVAIESADSFLRSSSVQAALDALHASRRVLFVFFDQFEELLTKDELLATFDAFKRLAFEIQSARANLVVGFSWRSGIALSDENPAYHVWHGLKDHRVDIVLDEFTSAESSRLVGQFEKELSTKLLPPLRRRLLEQGQGLPWLLKKLCIHVYREIRRGTHQEVLVSRRLNVNALFEEDLEPLTDAQTRCLRHIAENSPADATALFERFSQDTVNRLYNSRLIVRTGQKYAVYWDIFRDYLVEGAVPTIPWTYVPTVQFSMALRAVLLLRDRGPLALVELAEALGYAESTVSNIVTDLHNFMLATRDGQGRYCLRGELDEGTREGIAEFVSAELHEHVVLQTVYGALAPGEAMTVDQFRDAIRAAYSAANLRTGTVSAYANRLLPWFRFAGLLETSQDYITRPSGRGVDFGSPTVARGRRGVSGPMFMCSSTPDRAVDLARQLIRAGLLLRDDVLGQGNRNAASDLAALGLAVWQGDLLAPSDAFLQQSHATHRGVHDIVATRALGAEFLMQFARLRQQHPSSDMVYLGRQLASRLDRHWSDASARRYAYAARRWLRFCRTVTPTLL